MKNFLLVLILLLFVNTGYCAEIKRYVCTASTAGGDGTTSATTGANRAYASLEECMNANEQDLTDNGGDTFVVEITGDCSTADTTAVTIHNYTTSADCYINIYTTSTARHDGRVAAVSGRSNYRLFVNTQPNYGITIVNYYVTLDGIEIKNTHSSYGYALLHLVDNYAWYNTIKNNILHDSICWPQAILLTYSPYIKFYNNIVYNIHKDVSGNGGDGINAPWDTGTGQYYNNTFYNIANIAINGGIQSGRSIIVKNNLCYNNYQDFNRYFDASSNYNFSKDDTAPGANSIHGDTDSKTPDFISTSSGSEDFHLQSSSDAINVGTDLSSTFTDDIDGNTRSGTWDIGADEYVNPIQTNLIFNNSIFNNVQLN